MIEEIFKIVTAAGLSGLVVVWLLKKWISDRLRLSISHEYDRKLETLKDELVRTRLVASNVWQTKKNACFGALNIADAVLSNYKYENSSIDPIRQYQTIERVRTCYNELACTCETADGWWKRCQEPFS
jgi:hypothetical protein